MRLSGKIERFDFRARRAQGAFERLRVADPHNRVLFTVDQQHWRRAGTDIVDRLAFRTGAHAFEGGTAAVGVEGKEVIGTGEADDCAHRFVRYARILQPLRIQGYLRGIIGPGRVTRQNNPVRIAAITGDVPVHPTYYGCGILQHRRIAAGFV